MRLSETTTEILKALVAAQKEIKTVGKDRKNPFANSEYATLDNILEEVKPILNKNNIFVSQEAFTTETQTNVKIGVSTIFFHTSGEFVEYDPLFMTLEKGAKMNMAQSAGSIITYAKRYSLSASLGISTGEDTDGITNHGSTGSNQQQQQPNNQQKSNEQQIQEEIQKYQDYLLDSGVNLSDVTQYVLKKEGVENLNNVDPLRVMGHYKVLATTRRIKLAEEKKTMELQKNDEQIQQESFEGPQWGVKSKHD